MPSRGRRAHSPKPVLEHGRAHRQGDDLKWLIEINAAAATAPSRRLLLACGSWAVRAPPSDLADSRRPLTRFLRRFLRPV